MGDSTTEKEIALLAEAINVAIGAVEVAGLGQLVYKADENNLSNDPSNIIINNVAMAFVTVILQEKLKGMYDFNARSQAKEA